MGAAGEACAEGSDEEMSKAAAWRQVREDAAWLRERHDPDDPSYRADPEVLGQLLDAIEELERVTRVHEPDYDLDEDCSCGGGRNPCACCDGTGEAFDPSEGAADGRCPECDGSGLEP